MPLNWVFHGLRLAHLLVGLRWRPVVGVQADRAWCAGAKKASTAGRPGELLRLRRAPEAMASLQAAPAAIRATEERPEPRNGPWRRRGRRSFSGEDEPVDPAAAAEPRHVHFPPEEAPGVPRHALRRGEPAPLLAVEGGSSSGRRRDAGAWGRGPATGWRLSHTQRPFLQEAAELVQPLLAQRPVLRDDVVVA